MSLKQQFSNLSENVPLAKYTTSDVGGAAKFFTEAHDEQTLLSLISTAEDQKIPYLVLGGGSNVLISDDGFDGLVIINKIAGITQNGSELKVKSGTNLSDLVQYCLENGLSGSELLIGIPGTVGGAINGNAEAYRQHISDCLIEVKVSDGHLVFELAKDECGFSYRSSDLKLKKLIILEATFNFPSGDPTELNQSAQQTLTQRLTRYPLNLKYPGSFFRNVDIDSVTTESLAKIPVDKIRSNRIFVGYLLEQIHNQGRSLGKIKVTDYHANLFINTGDGTAADFFELAKQAAQLVFEKFGIKIIPEVQLINLPKFTD